MKKIAKPLKKGISFTFSGCFFLSLHFIIDNYVYTYCQIHYLQILSALMTASLFYLKEMMTWTTNDKLHNLHAFAKNADSMTNMK